MLELPGGRIQFGETIEEALIREIKEETNLEVIPQKVLSTWDYRKKTGDFQVVGLVFDVYVKDLTQLTLSEEHDAYQWLSLDQVDQLVPHFKKCLEQINIK
ncbi:NUDIX domain-containing protein [Streptococcus cameli]